MSVVLKMPFKYGHSSGEWKFSWVWARINPFASKANSFVSYFPNKLVLFFSSASSGIRPAHLEKAYEPLAVGDAVRGLVSWTDIEYRSANLLGWRPATSQGWSHASPHSFNWDGIGLDREALYNLPPLGCKYISPTADMLPI